jgi:hypothetical protein
MKSRYVYFLIGAYDYDAVFEIHPTGDAAVDSLLSSADDFKSTWPRYSHEWWSDLEECLGPSDWTDWAVFRFDCHFHTYTQWTGREDRDV